MLMLYLVHVLTLSLLPTLLSEARITSFNPPSPAAHLAAWSFPSITFPNRLINSSGCPRWLVKVTESPTWCMMEENGGAVEGF